MVNTSSVRRMMINPTLQTANSRIVVDSCCDLSIKINDWLNAHPVALTMRLGTKEFSDDHNLNLEDFMEQMQACRDSVGSASPPPVTYQSAFSCALPTFAVTLSSKLSGSYDSAMLGKQMAEENGCGPIHVFDSKSASAGETLVAVKLRQMINQGLERSEIIRGMEAFIDNMKTYFVLERYDNLQKNGRLSKVAGKLISVMNIKLLMGADGEGNIALFGKPRGTNNMLEKLLSLIADSGKQTEGQDLVISHCNNQDLANQLCRLVRSRFRFKEIHIIPTGGISSLYADDKGIVIAF